MSEPTRTETRLFTVSEQAAEFVRGYAKAVDDYRQGRPWRHGDDDGDALMLGDLARANAHLRPGELPPGEPDLYQRLDWEQTRAVVRTVLDGRALGEMVRAEDVPSVIESTWEPTSPVTGQVVFYRARTRGYVLPAIVTATTATLDPEGVRRGDVQPLLDDQHVHLHVMTCGAQVAYQEHNVAHDEAEDAPGGTWCWAPLPAMTP